MALLCTHGPPKTEREEGANKGKREIEEPEKGNLSSAFFSLKWEFEAGAEHGEGISGAGFEESRALYLGQRRWRADGECLEVKRM